MRTSLAMIFLLWAANTAFAGDKILLKAKRNKFNSDYSPARLYPDRLEIKEKHGQRFLELQTISSKSAHAILKEVTIGDERILIVAAGRDNPAAITNSWESQAAWDGFDIYSISIADNKVRRYDRNSTGAYPFGDDLGSLKADKNMGKEAVTAVGLDGTNLHVMKGNITGHDPDGDRPYIYIEKGGTVLRLDSPFMRRAPPHRFRTRFSEEFTIEPSEK